MTAIKFTTAQYILMTIGGTAAGQAFGMNRDNAIGTKRGSTKSPKSKCRK
jgi:hypothetical protein